MQSLCSSWTTRWLEFWGWRTTRKKAGSMTLQMIQTHPNHIRGPIIHQMIKTHRIIQTVGTANWFSTCSSHSQDTYLLRKDFYSTVSLDRQTLYWTESLWMATTSYCTTPQGEFPDAVKDIDYIRVIINIPGNNLSRQKSQSKSIQANKPIRFWT